MNDTNTAAANTMISTSPKRPSWFSTIAQGNRKMISMSKTMKIMAIR
jgi:hypothetical protein